MEKASGEYSIVGFEYQYNYFIYRLLAMSQGDSVGFECKDDVHTQLDHDQQVLYQLKHTTQTSVGGFSKNLTLLDHDLWKTLSNWAKVISDRAAKRGSTKAQLKFLSKTHFVLLSNKSKSPKNKILSAFPDLRSGAMAFNNVKSMIQSLKKATNDKKIECYIRTIFTLSDPVLEEFFRKVNFELNEDSIYERSLLCIKETRMVPENRVESVYGIISSAVRKHFVDEVLKGQAFVMSSTLFYKKYRRVFDKARNEKLRFSSPKITLPDEVEKQPFIMQLIAIKDLDEKDHEDMIRFTGYLLNTKAHIAEWLQEGDLTDIETAVFQKTAILFWESRYRQEYKGSTLTEEQVNEAARRILSAVRDKDLKIGEQELGLELSNGQYYGLSDDLMIGWRNDWEERYRK